MVFIDGMTIWILALVLLGSGIGMGFRQGVIRAAFSFLGIVFAGLLAAPLGKPFKLLLPHLGIHSETMVWMIAPIEAFVLVLILFKVTGFFVHRKVDLYYKYRAGDLQFSLWERLNSRLGACVGTLNGAAYLVLVCFVIYNFSYWTVQIASSDNETRTTKFINRAGRDLESTGMAKAAHSVATMPDNFYKMADLAGLICQNPQLNDRLGHYPPFLSLMERDDLHQLADNSDFISAWGSHAPMGQLMNQPEIKTILQNNDLLNTVWTTVQSNLDDLIVYLKTGKSPKYDSEKILGRWDFDIGVSLAMLRQAQPNIPSAQMRVVRAMWIQGYASTTFVAASDGQAFLKSFPDFNKKQPPTLEVWKGSWTADGTNYDLTLTSNGENKSMTGKFSGIRLILTDDKNTLVFDRED
jgi:hypothetical protein